MLSEFLNLEAFEYSTSLFKISAERIDELTEQWQSIAKEIGNNYTEYSDMREIKGDLKNTFHSGKVLSKFLSVSKNEQEELITLFSFYHIMGLCQNEALNYLIENNPSHD